MANDEQMAQAVVASWKLVIGRLEKFVAKLDAADFERQVAPGRNRLRYLVGHLVVVHDRMFELLGVGARLHPELDEAYLANPDGTIADPLSVTELRAAWSEVNARLTESFEAMTPAEWLKKHAAVSEEEFAKDPSRNKLAVVLSRTSHAASHAGQMLLAK